MRKLALVLLAIAMIAASKPALAQASAGQAMLRGVTNALGQKFLAGKSIPRIGKMPEENDQSINAAEARIGLAAAACGTCAVVLTGPASVPAAMGAGTLNQFNSEVGKRLVPVVPGEGRGRVRARAAVTSILVFNGLWYGGAVMAVLTGGLVLTPAFMAAAAAAGVTAGGMVILLSPAPQPRQPPPGAIVLPSGDILPPPPAESSNVPRPPGAPTLPPLQVPPPGSSVFTDALNQRLDPLNCGRREFRFEEALANGNDADLTNLMKNGPVTCSLNPPPPPVIVVSSCKDGQTQIEAAKQSGNAVLVASLNAVVKTVCDKETKSEHPKKKTATRHSQTKHHPPAEPQPQLSPDDIAAGIGIAVGIANALGRHQGGGGSRGCHPYRDGRPGMDCSGH
jgi:hypothetical protein